MVKTRGWGCAKGGKTKKMAAGGSVGAAGKPTNWKPTRKGGGLTNQKPIFKGKRMADGGMAISSSDYLKPDGAQTNMPAPSSNRIRYGGTNTNEPAGPGGYGGTGNGGVSGGINGGGQGYGGPAGGVTTGTTTGTSATNRPQRPTPPRRPVAPPQPPVPIKKPAPPTARNPVKEPPLPPGGLMFGDGSMWPGQGGRPMGGGYNPPDVPDEVVPGPRHRAVWREMSGRASLPAFRSAGPKPVMRKGGLAGKKRSK